MQTLEWIRSFAVIAALSLVAGCSNSHDRHGMSGRGGDAPARLASARDDGGTDRVTLDNGMVRSSLAFPTGERETSIVLLEATGPEQVRVGQPYDYTLQVTNLTDTPLHDVRVKHIPGEMPGSTDTPGRPSTRPTGHFAGVDDGEPQVAAARTGSAADRDAMNSMGGEDVWTVGTLAAGQTRSQKMVGTADQEGMIANCLSVSYQPTLCVAVKVVKPELAVLKQAPREVLICQPIEYTYRVSNTGSGAIQNVRLTDELPEGLQTANGERTFSADVGTLNAGQSKDIKANLRATKTGTFSSRAVARSGQTTAQSRDVGPVVEQPVLQVGVEGPEAVYVGQAVNFRVTVRNTSDVPAQKTVVKLSSAGGSERLTPRDLGTIPAGESRSFAVNAGTGKSGNVGLTAAAEAMCAVPAQDNASVSILTIAALQLEAIDGQDPVRVGENTSYTITVRNEGSGPAQNVVLSATLPPELSFVRGAGASAVSAEGKQVKFAPIASIPAGNNVTWTIDVKAEKAGDARFYVEMNADSLTRPAAETEPTRVVTPDAADLPRGDGVRPAPGEPNK